MRARAHTHAHIRIHKYEFMHKSIKLNFIWEMMMKMMMMMTMMTTTTMMMMIQIKPPLTINHQTANIIVSLFTARYHKTDNTVTIIVIHQLR